MQQWIEEDHDAGARPACGVGRARPGHDPGTAPNARDLGLHCRQGLSLAAKPELGKIEAPNPNRARNVPSRGGNVIRLRALLPRSRSSSRRSLRLAERGRGPLAGGDTGKRRDFQRCALLDGKMARRLEAKRRACTAGGGMARWSSSAIFPAKTSIGVKRATGTPVDDVRFAPLGIADVEWYRNAKGDPIAAGALRLRPRDLAKIASSCCSTAPRTARGSCRPRRSRRRQRADQRIGLRLALLWLFLLAGPIACRQARSPVDGRGGSRRTTRLHRAGARSCGRGQELAATHGAGPHPQSACAESGRLAIDQRLPRRKDRARRNLQSLPYA